MELATLYRSQRGPWLDRPPRWASDQEIEEARRKSPKVRGLITRIVIGDDGRLLTVSGRDGSGRFPLLVRRGQIAVWDCELERVRPEWSQELDPGGTFPPHGSTGIVIEPFQCAQEKGDAAGMPMGGRDGGGWRTVRWHVVGWR